MSRWQRQLPPNTSTATEGLSPSRSKSESAEKVPARLSWKQPAEFNPSKNVKRAKLPLNLLYTLGAARVVIAFVPAFYSGPSDFSCHDRN